MKKIEFDSKSELKELSLKRLFVLQKIEINNLKHYLLNQYIYDKNDINNKLEEIDVINTIILKKINEKK